MSYLTRYSIYDKDNKLIRKYNNICFKDLKEYGINFDKFSYIDLILPIQSEVGKYEVYYIEQELLEKSIDNLNKIDAFKDAVSLQPDVDGHRIVRYYFKENFLKNYQTILRPLSILRYLYEVTNMMKAKNGNWFYQTLNEIVEKDEYDLNYVLIPLEFMHWSLIGGGYGHSVSYACKLNKKLSLIENFSTIENYGDKLVYGGDAFLSDFTYQGFEDYYKHLKIKKAK